MSEYSGYFVYSLLLLNSTTDTESSQHGVSQCKTAVSQLIQRIWVMQEQQHLNARVERFAIRRHKQFGGCTPLPAIPSCQAVACCQRFWVAAKWNLEVTQQSAGTSIFVTGCKRPSPWNRNLKLCCWQPAILDNQHDAKQIFPSNGNASCLVHLAEKCRPMLLVKWIVKIFGEEFESPYLATLVCFGSLKQLFAGMEWREVGDGLGPFECSRKEDREARLSSQRPRQMWSWKV